MRQTNEQREATAHLRTIAGGYRIELDAEGWPMIPGRLGRIEYYDGTWLAVFADRRRLHSRILAIPGVQRHQTGDEELRALFPPDSLSEVAKTIKARRKRMPSPAILENLAAVGAATRFLAGSARTLGVIQDENNPMPVGPRRAP
jgi:hypothetical protein